MILLPIGPVTKWSDSILECYCLNGVILVLIDLDPFSLDTILETKKLMIQVSVIVEWPTDKEISHKVPTVQEYTRLLKLDQTNPDIENLCAKKKY